MDGNDHERVFHLNPESLLDAVENKSFFNVKPEMDLGLSQSDGVRRDRAQRPVSN